MEVFSLKNFSFSYPVNDSGRFFLKNINLAVREGEYISVCGKSGSGKSTLLKHLKSALAPHGKCSGEVLFCGVPLDKVGLREQASQIGFVMQNPDNQIVTDKVWNELAFGLESLGFDTETIRLRVAEMASFFGIQTWFLKDVTQLSGGQKQLLNLASVMAMQPKVLILDEPTSQLDPIASADFLAAVKKINNELGVTVIITEHRMEDIFPVSDRVVVMDNGEIIANDTPKKTGEILKSLKHDMLFSMPAPMRIYSEIESESKKNCPLTVREGRQWLAETLDGKNIIYKNIDTPEKNGSKNDFVIEMKEVWFRYGKSDPDAVKDLSVKIRRNGIYAIVGGNGTGKTTALTLICGINKAYRGKILLNGKNIHKYKSNELFNKNLGVLPQNPQALFVKSTVRADLEEIYDGKNIDHEKIRKLSELLQIDFLLDMHPYDLSGGEQQRAALAKVLLLEPKILLLDEPTKGLDSYFKNTLGEILVKLKNSGVTIVFVSHDVEFCAKFADRCAMFFNGSVITENTPSKFFSGNNFYTTSANRMSRHIFENAVTAEDVIYLCRKNMQNNKKQT